MKRNNVTYNIAYESTTYVWYGVTLYSANVTLLMLRNIAPDSLCAYFGNVTFPDDVAKAARRRGTGAITLVKT